MNSQREILGLTRSHQLVAGIAVTLFLLASIFYFWQLSITNGGLIDFENIPSRSYSYEVDINSAAWAEFANLPGIGEKLAQQIVEYRARCGGFENKEQLLDVSGIGPAKYKNVLPYVVVGPLEIEGGN